MKNRGARHFENFVRGFQKYRGINPKDSQDSRGFLGIPGDSKGFLRIRGDSRGFLRIRGDSRGFSGSQGFSGVKSMGFLRILRDSAKIHGDSQGFSGFPRKPYEVSGVSSPRRQRPKLTFRHPISSQYAQPLSFGNKGVSTAGFSC